MPAGERLYCQVDPFMPLEIVVAIERLRALVTFKWPVVLLRWGRGDEVLLSWLRGRLWRGVYLLLLLNTGQTHRGR